MRVAAKAQEELYAAIKRDGGTHNAVEQMQTRAELYATIGYHDYEALDASHRQDHHPDRDAPERRLAARPSAYRSSNPSAAKAARIRSRPLSEAAPRRRLTTVRVQAAGRSACSAWKPSIAKS